MNRSRVENTSRVKTRKSGDDVLFGEHGQEVGTTSCLGSTVKRWGRRPV